MLWKFVRQVVREFLVIDQESVHLLLKKIYILA